MCFLIEIESHERLNVRDPEDSTTSEAIESVYPLGQAVRIYVAPHVWVRLPVSGGVSDIYDDTIAMLKRLEQGDYPFEITFLCNCFTAIWRFSESNGVLTIRTSWTAVDARSKGREIRDAHFNDEVSQFAVEKKTFVAEWRKLLGQIKWDLLSAGYDRSLDNFEYLEQLGSEP